VNLTLVAILALIGAALCWCALAAPELPAAGRAVARWARGAFRLEAVRVDLAQAELHRVSPGVWIRAAVRSRPSASERCWTPSASGRR
jgi:hypothetical protein